MERNEQHFNKEIWKELNKVVPFPVFVKKHQNGIRVL
jgi:hypothetical protein